MVNLLTQYTFAFIVKYAKNFKQNAKDVEVLDIITKEKKGKLKKLEGNEVKSIKGYRLITTQGLKESKLVLSELISGYIFRANLILSENSNNTREVNGMLNNQRKYEFMVYLDNKGLVKQSILYNIPAMTDYMLPISGLPCRMILEI